MGTTMIDCLERAARRRARRFALCAAALLLAAVGGAPRAEEDVVARMRAAYAALASYSDTATIETELGTRGGPLIRERHTFTTRFRKPRHFYFELNEDRSAGSDRFVIWSDDEAFKTWWKTTGVAETYPPGRGAAALVTAFGVTDGAAAITAPLLFPQANLRGALLDFTDGVVEGVERVGERECHRVKGVQRPVYGTGRSAQVRETTLWIDTETFLLCRMLEDTPQGAPAGTVQRVTTTLEPQVNPDLTDDAFRFEPPQD